LVTLVSLPGQCGRFVAYDCLGPKDDQETVWFYHEHSRTAGPT
jgi:hypothetical protein